MDEGCGMGGALYEPSVVGPRRGVVGLRCMTLEVSSLQGLLT